MLWRHNIHILLFLQLYGRYLDHVCKRRFQKHISNTIIYRLLPYYLFRLLKLIGFDFTRLQIKNNSFSSCFLYFRSQLYRSNLTIWFRRTCRRCRPRRFYRFLRTSRSTPNSRVPSSEPARASSSTNTSTSHRHQSGASTTALQCRRAPTLRSTSTS